MLELFTDGEHFLFLLLGARGENVEQYGQELPFRNYSQYPVPGSDDLK